MTSKAAPAVSAKPQRDKVPLVMHVIHALRIGGLENGLVNLVNHMDRTRFRHAIVCMTDYSDFRDRIEDPGVEVFALHKERLSRWGILTALRRLFRERRPSIVHGRNWDGLDAAIPAVLAGVPVRIQGEHGRDMHDLDGSSKRQQWLRRINRPFTTHYTTVSRDLADYLIGQVGIPAARVTQIYNGVDTLKFRPRNESDSDVIRACGVEAGDFVVGTVGRLAAVKDQAALIRAAAQVRRNAGPAAERLKVLLVGDGPLRSDLDELVRDESMEASVIFAGAQNDVPRWMRAMDVFVLPSRAEGISNTILEAMASGLPVLASNVGGNGDLVAEAQTGFLFPAGDAEALAAGIVRYLCDPALRTLHGRASRARVEAAFSIRAMVQGYSDLYDRLVGRVRVETPVRAERRGAAQT